MPRAKTFLSLWAAALLSSCARFGPVGGPNEWRAAMQPELGQAEARQVREGPSLSQAIELAAHRNPGVQAARRDWLAAIHREPQATAPPDPMISELSYDFTMNEWANLKAEAAIPWWRKLWAAGRMAAAEADVARLKYEAALRDLIVDVKDSCYELYYIDQASAITEKIETQFRNDAILAYEETNTGRAQLNEAFRAESQAAQLAYDRILLREQRAAQAERLRSLLNLPSGAVIGPIRAAPSYEISDQIEPLYQRAEQYAETLKIRGLEIQRARYDVLLARLARVPDVTLGGLIQNFAGPDKPMITPDAITLQKSYMGMVSFNLPIWEWRNRALVREKEATEDAMKFEALNEANQVRRMTAMAYFEARLNRRLADLYSNTLLPQAEAVMRQAEIFFRTGAGSFSTVLETTLAFHNFQLAWHRAVANYGQSVGRLEQVLGATAKSPRAKTRIER